MTNHETQTLYGELQEGMVDKWKEQVIKAHRESGHDYVAFDYRLDNTSSQFQYRIKAGGYEDEYPDWIDEEVGLEVVDIREE